MVTILNILPLKKMPDLFWTARTSFTIRPPTISFQFLLLSLIVFGFAHLFLFAANLGISPWMVFIFGTNRSMGSEGSWFSPLVIFTKKASNLPEHQKSIAMPLRSQSP